MNKFNELIKNNVLFDSHCHVNFEGYDGDRKAVIENASSNGVEYVIDIATDYKSSEKSLVLNEQFPTILGTVGVDPEAFIQGSDLYIGEPEKVWQEFRAVEALADSHGEKIVMIGETGIDMYWNTQNKVDADVLAISLENQKELFRKHIELAIKLNLPLSIHSRNAIDTCLDILTSSNLTTNSSANLLIRQENSAIAVFHSLTPDLGDDENIFYRKINQILEAKYMIGLNGIITYKNANLLRDSVVKVIKERSSDLSDITPKTFYDAGFVFETDGPFLAPEGMRGSRNEPANVKIIYDFMANLFN